MNPNHCRKIYSNGLDSYRLPAKLGWFRGIKFIKATVV